MLSHAKLPKFFWGEAMRTVVDSINFSPIVVLDSGVPNRVWTGKDVFYDHLRVFACRAYVHVLEYGRSRFDGVKVKPCVFIGYCHKEFTYKLWDPVNKKIARSKDVVFLEGQVTDYGNQGEFPSSSVGVLVNLDLMSSLMVNANQGGGV